MQKCFLLLLKHPQNLVFLHALFAVGIVKAKSPLSDLQVVFVFMMFPISWDPPPPPPPPPPPSLALLDSPLTELRRRRAQKTTSMLASQVQNREMISSDKRNSSIINSPNTSSSQTLGVESTSRDPGC